MKLLILTQKVDKNDDVLGFFYEWLQEFSGKVEKLTVICLQKGGCGQLNSPVLSLGKPAQGWSASGGETLIQKVVAFLRFYKYIWQERKNYDAIFVHMNSEYVLLGAPVWKLLNKKTGLWYVHKAVDWKLRLAEKLTDVIFTASQKSFRLESDKVRVVGHGIDVDRFKPSGEIKKDSSIISVGRIAPVKNYEFLIDAAKILDDRGVKFDIKIVGAPILDSDKVYLESLKERVKKGNLDSRVHFLGGVSYEQIMNIYSGAKIFINLSDTGSLDKAVLEAMAAGLLVLTSNEAFRDILADRYFTSKDPLVIADKLAKLMQQDGDPELRKHVVKNHSLKYLIDKILLAYV